jgi:cytochrome c biogenesis protein CcmG/thiol:disulfide interchange protein DsbE
VGAAVGVVGVLLVGAVAALAAGGGDSAPARAAPPFSVEDVRDPTTTVSLPTGRPAVVNFFAAWCEPCREELPILQRAWARHGSRVAFVGIDVADSRTRAAEFLAGAAVTFPAGYDPRREVAGAYRLIGMPTTVFVGADGRIAGTVKGPLTEPTLDRWLDQL